MATVSPFGERLRVWRGRRGLSQLDLAYAAGTTPRYVSFIETGRSRPGVGVVLRLADALGLPMREQNALLAAAGLPPVFPESPLDDARMAPIRRVIDMVLANHDPFPAWSFGPGLRVLGSNATAEQLMPGMTALSPQSLIDLWCTPEPGATRAEAAASVHQAIAALRREQLHHPHPDLPDLLRRAESHAVGLGAVPEAPDEPVLVGTMMLGGQELRTVSTVMRFDKAADVTASEIRVELVFPADAETEARFRQLAVSSADGTSP